MPKRQRRSSAEVVQVNQDGTAVVESGDKQYCWYVPENISLDKIIDTNEFEIAIIHNFENRAMIDIVSIRKDEMYLRQEVNPLKYKDSDDWVVDE